MLRLLLLGSLLVPALALASPVWQGLGAKGAPGADVEVTAKVAADGTVTVRADLGGVWQEVTEVEGRPFVRLDLTGGGACGDAGTPRRPVIRRRVALPLGGAVKVDARRSDPVVHALDHPLLPAQPAQSKCDAAPAFALNDKAYTRTWDDAPARIVSIQTLRGARHAILELRPVRYDPTAGTVTIYRHIEVRLRTDAPRMAATRRVLQARLPGLSRGVSAQILGLSDLLGKDALDASPPHVVFVIADDAGQGFEPVLEPLMAWKREKGLPVTVLRTSEIGGTKEQIKAALRELYAAPEQAPAYAILVGDVQHIPFWMGTGDGDQQAADMYYATMDADDAQYTDDQVPDFHVGRFSVATADELAVVVQKTLAFERPIDPEAPWYSRSLWVASDDHDALGRETHQWVTPAFEAAGMEVTTAFKDEIGEAEAVRISHEAIALGQSIINYSGHGWHEGWVCVPLDNEDLYALPETGAHPFVITNACQTGQFQHNDQGDCFSEAWLKAPGAAVASWAASNNSLWDEDDLIEKAVWSALWPSLRTLDDDPHMAGYPWPEGERFTTIGEITDMGLLVFHERAEAAWSVRYAVEEYNVLGDPSLDLWTEQPRAVEVLSPGVLMLGQAELTLQVSTADGPTAHALVAFNHGGVSVAGYTDEGGEVSFDVSGVETPGEASVVVTGHNLMPHESGIMVTPPGGAYLGLRGYGFDDGEAAPAEGDANGHASPGERLALRAQVSNFGDEPVQDAVATLVVDDPCVEVVDGEHQIGALAAQSEPQDLAPFVFDVRACENGHRVELSVRFSAGDARWETPLRLTVLNAVSLGAIIEATGANVPGAEISWRGPAEGSLQIGRLGRSERVVDFPAGHYTFTATAWQYTTEVRELDLPTDAAITLRLGRPTVELPEQVEVFLSAEHPTASANLDVGNSGDRPLNFALSTSYPLGDDAFGYRYDHSGEGGSLGTRWIEIPEADRHVLVLGDDDDRAIDLPFDFPYYGGVEARVNIGSNGYINFGASQPDAPWRAEGMPSRSMPAGLVAVHYEDLDPSDMGSVYWGEVAGDVVITWDDVPHYGEAAPKRFQCVLKPSGAIDLNYDHASGDAIIGLQSPDASQGMELELPSSHTDLSVSVSTSNAHITALVAEGVVAPGQTESPMIEVALGDLQLGQHALQLRVSSDDPRTPATSIMVLVNVVEGDADTDGDGVLDAVDNCPAVPNADQLDDDDDGRGDACQCEVDGCDDENVCTDDVCDATLGCVYTANEVSCDDGDACTENMCVEGACEVVDTIEPCCEPSEVLGCYDDDLYHLDTCDAPGGLAERCEGGCAEGACLAPDQPDIGVSDGGDGDADQDRPEVGGSGGCQLIPGGGVPGPVVLLPFVALLGLRRRRSRVSVSRG